MPSAITAVFGADARPMQRELAAAQAMANRAARNIEASFSGGGHGHGAVGMGLVGGGRGGVIGEALVLFRELGRGNWSRIPGSFTILAQRMGLLKLLLKDNASAATVTAAAYNELAQKASLAALAATRKAQASQEALFNTGGDIMANLKAANTDTVAAQAAMLNAQALTRKAEAAGSAAEEEKALAGATAMSVGPLGVVASILAAIAVGAYVAYQRYKDLVGALSSLAPADSPLTYFAERFSKAGYAEESWLKIHQALRTVIEDYNSVEQVYKRIATLTDMQFDHESNLLSLRKEMADAVFGKSPIGKFMVEQNYTREQLNLEKRRRDEQHQRLLNEARDLEAQGMARRREALGINLRIPSAQEAQANLANARANAEAMLKRAKEIEAGRGPTLISSFFRFIGGEKAAEKIENVGLGRAITNSNSGVKQIYQGEQQQIQQAWEAMKTFRDVTNRNANLDRPEGLRTLMEQREKQALDSFTDAQKARNEANTMEKINAEKDRLSEELANAKLAKAGIDMLSGAPNHGMINSLQKIGAFTGVTSDQGLAMEKLQVELLRSINDKLGKQHALQTGENMFISMMTGGVRF